MLRKQISTYNNYFGLHLKVTDKILETTNKWRATLYLVLRKASQVVCPIEQAN
jgi:hypothetical protein